MKLKCPSCNHEYEISPAAILGKEGGRKSRRAITPEQQAKMQAARVSDWIAEKAKGEV